MGKQGFGAISAKRHREICSMGGKAAHKKGVAHEWDTEEAREAGRQGGLVTHERKRQAKAAAAWPPEDPGGELAGGEPKQDAGVRPQGDVRHEPEVT